MTTLRVGLGLLVYGVFSAVLAANATAETVLLDFTATWCGPCRATAPHIDRLAAEGFSVRKVDFDREKALANQYGVSAVPTFVLIKDGREVNRLVGGTSYERLRAMFQQAGVTPSSVSHQTSDGPSGATAGLPSSVPSSPSSLTPQASSLTPGATAGLPSSAPPSKILAPNPSSLTPTSDNRILAASVRLRVRDERSTAHGSGTIIDARNEKALILTCGHLFRESAGKGQILVDLFGSPPAENVPGELIGYDLDRDLALIAIRPPSPVTAAPVAASANGISKGQRVTSVGCDNGQVPMARPSRVNAVNKFLGPANISADGEPSQGRSGGGLFNEQGEIIGVCNAANPEDREGLYAALPAIHAQLDDAKLSFIYRRGAAPHSATASASGWASSGNPTSPPAENSAAATPPAAAPSMGNSPFASPPAATPTRGNAIAEAAGNASGADSAEVVCVVRNLSDPRAKSSVVVLDRVSQSFLAQLEREQSAQLARRQTSLVKPTPSSSDTLKWRPPQSAR